MKKLILLAALASASCTDHPSPPGYSTVLQKGETVRICGDGTRISRYKGYYAFYTPGGAFFDAGSSAGFLPSGITLQEFCT